MDYRQLGRSGVRVSPLCLGCWNFGEPTDEATAIRLIHKALDAGINFLDTANMYNAGRSEEIVGKALAGKRDNVILATKAFGRVGQGPNDWGISRFHLMREVEKSLRRLATDWIDLYQMHRPDDTTPIDETLSALTDLVRQGKVRYLGLSTFPAWQIVESLWVSERYGYERFICEQPPYSIFDRKIEREVLPVCKRYGLGVIPWSPLEGGWLAGRYQRGQPAPQGSRAERHKWDLASEKSLRRFDALDQLAPLAKECGHTLSQFALNWTLANPVITAPIIGPRTEEHLDDSLGALGWSIPQEILQKVDEIVPPGGEL